MDQLMENQSKAIQELMLPVQQLQANPWNRKSFDIQGMQELTESVKSKGILEPLIVRKKLDGKYEIASGERRWRAALQAGLTEVPCRDMELTDEDVQDMNLIANIQREDIPALEKAAMVKARMDSSGVTQLQMAKRLGKSEVWLSELLAFLNLPDKVHETVSGLAMNTNQLKAIATLPNADYQEQIAQELQAGKIKPAQVEQRAHQLHNGFKAAMAKRAKKNRTADEAETANDSLKPSSPAAAGGGSIKPINGHDGFPPTTRGNDGKVAASSAVLPSLITGLKDDLADAYLPSFGRVGSVLRSGLDKANGRSLIKWGLMFTVVSFLWHPVLKTINYVFTRVMHVEVNQAINKNTIPPVSAVVAAVEAPKMTPAMLTKVQAPTGLTAELVSGHRVRFKWQPVPGVFGYNFYCAYENLDFKQENQKPLKEPTALWEPDSGAARYQFTITAVDSDDHESLYSEPVTVDMR